jgi:tRNA/rRNA methyltransferase
MLAMELEHLVLVSPQRFPHPDAKAMAAGADVVLDTVRCVDSLGDALAGAALSIGFTARPREFAGTVMNVREAAADALRHAEAGEVALVFGNEMSGLSNAELAECGAVATIPTCSEFASLNLAAAVQIAAYELRVAALGDAVWTAPRFAPASQDEIERLYGHAEEVLIDLDFLRPAHPKRLMPRLRRLFGRARLEREEVNILRGILARIQQRLSRNPPN